MKKREKVQQRSPRLNSSKSKEQKSATRKDDSQEFLWEAQLRAMDGRATSAFGNDSSAARSRKEGSSLDDSNPGVKPVRDSKLKCATKGLSQLQKATSVPSTLKSSASARLLSHGQTKAVNRLHAEKQDSTSRHSRHSEEGEVN